MATRKVLLIDDDLLFYRELSQNLTPYGFEVHQAGHNDDSLAQAVSLEAELIFIAVDLPEKLGFVLCHKAKKKRGGPPVILKTSSIDPEGFKKHKKLKSHADAYIDQRELSQEELLGCVDSLIGLGGLQNEEDIDIDIDELHLDEYEVEELDADYDLNEDEEVEYDGGERTTISPSILMPELLGQVSPFDESREEDVISEQTIVAPKDLFGLDENAPGLESDISDALDSLSGETVVPQGFIAAGFPVDQRDPDTPVPAIDVSEEIEISIGENSEIEINESEVLLAEPLEPDSPFEEKTVEGQFADMPIGEVLAKAQPASLLAGEVLTEAQPADLLIEESTEAKEPPTLDSVVETIAAPEMEGPLENENIDDLDLGLEDVAEAAAEEKETASSMDSSEIAALRAENAKLKETLENQPQAVASGFSREHEFLDLREKINQKEKALLDTQDLLTLKEREVLDTKDSLRKLNREKSEINDTNLKLEHELLEAKENTAALNAKLSQAAKNSTALIESHRRTLEEKQAEQEEKLAKSAADKTQALQEAADTQRQALATASEDENDRATQAHTEAEVRMQSALEKAGALHTEQQETLRKEKEGELSTLAEEHAIANSENKSQHESQVEDLLKAAEAEEQGLKDQHVGQLSRLKEESLQERVELEANHKNTLEKVQNDNEEFVHTLRTEQQETAAAATAAALAATEAAAAVHRDVLAQTNHEHEESQTAALAAADTQKHEELQVAAQELANLDARRQEELSAAGEERDASEAQLIEKASADRAALEQEHRDVVSGLQQEGNDLEAALSGSRSCLADTEKALEELQAEMGERESTIERNEETIALRDDKIQGLEAEGKDLEEQNAEYQEQILKVYQKIKTDENTVERAKKALAIALTLLDETNTISSLEEEPV